MKKRRALVTIGWREWVALPEFGVPRIKAKVDTGARTSALHAFDVEPFSVGGVEWIRFKIHPIQRDDRTVVGVEAPLVGERDVRSSSGRVTRRPVVRTRIGLAGSIWPIELTLVRRDLMGFRMLLGRRVLRRRFLIDPGRSFLGGE